MADVMIQEHIGLAEGKRAGQTFTPPYFTLRSEVETSFNQGKLHLELFFQRKCGTPKVGLNSIRLRLYLEKVTLGLGYMFR